MSSVPPPPLPSSRANHPRAIASLVCAIVGVLLLGIVLGVVAIALGYQARNAIRKDPVSFKGEGLATAGMAIGVIAVVTHVLVLAGLFGT